MDAEAQKLTSMAAWDWGMALITALPPAYADATFLAEAGSSLLPPKGEGAK